MDACGNGQIDPGEDCDDGDVASGDGCDEECEYEALQIAAGSAVTCAVLIDGVKCWGENQYGQLGQGDTEHRGDDFGEMGVDLAAIDLGFAAGVEEVAVGGIHTCARSFANEVKCWGVNVSGHLGIGDTEHRGDDPFELGDALPLVDVDGVIERLSAGVTSACAHLDNDDVKCWGTGSMGQLGNGSPSSIGDAPGEMGAALAPLDFGNAVDALSIAVGVTHACAVLSDGDVKCWGRNQAGQLGVGDTQSRGDAPNEMGNALPAVPLQQPAAIQADAGSEHSCAVLGDGSVWCWGTASILGLGLSEGSVGDQANEVALSAAVDLGPGVAAQSLCTGGGFTCAVVEDGELKCWGSNALGSLGLGNTESRGDEPNEMGDNLPFVDLGRDFTASSVACGHWHACALSETGVVKCWGGNERGQLGLGDEATRGDEPDEMGEWLPKVDL